MELASVQPRISERHNDATISHYSASSLIFHNAPHQPLFCMVFKPSKFLKFDKNDDAP